jgi:hypothetical protein
VGFFAVAAFIQRRGYGRSQVADASCGFRLLLRLWFCVFTLVMFLVIVTADAYTVLAADITLGKTFAVHFQTSCFLTVASLLLYFAL